MALVPPSKEVEMTMAQELDVEDEDKAERIKEIMNWLSLNPHLPRVTDEQWVYRFLYGCKLDLARTKSVLETYFRVRQSVPELFHNRDPLQRDLQGSFDSLYYFPLPKHTPQGHRVNMFKLRPSDSAHFDPLHFVRRVFMIADVRLQEETCLGDVMVFDCEGFDLGHLGRFSLVLARKFLMCAQDALPTRIKSMHFVNSPTFIDRILSFFKAFMKDKLAKRIFVHTGGYNTLHDVIPKHILPSDYDGDGGTMEELNEAWRQKLVDYREFFLKQEELCKRTAAKPTDMDFGLPGSFKQLIID